MNDQDQIELSEEEKALELENIRQRATMLGVKFHHNAGVEKIQELIKAHNAEQAMPKVEETPVKGQNVEVKETANERVRRLRQEASKLVRVIITCKNPAKKEHGGQLFCVGNGVVGTFTKFVPFENQEGWHVPQIILDQIKASEYQYFYDDPKNPNIRLSKRVKEFVIDILDPLTSEELHDLAQRQAMGKNID